MIGGITLMWSVSNCGPDTVNNYYGNDKTPAKKNGDYEPDDYTAKQQACRDALISCEKKTGNHWNLSFCTSELAQKPGCLDCVINAPCSNDFKVGRGTPVAYCLYTKDCPK